MRTLTNKAPTNFDRRAFAEMLRRRVYETVGAPQGLDYEALPCGLVRIDAGRSRIGSRAFAGNGVEFAFGRDGTIRVEHEGGSFVEQLLAIADRLLGELNAA